MASDPTDNIRSLRRMMFLCSLILSAALIYAAWLVKPSRYEIFWPAHLDRPVLFDLRSGQAVTGNRPPEGMMLHKD